MATGAIGSVVPKLFELLKEEYGLQKGLKQRIRRLSRDLEDAKAALTKIGDVPWEDLNPQVRLWARDIREASYDMEDIVDTFLVRVDAPEQTDANVLRRLRKNMGSLFKKSKARRKISKLIQDIEDKLNEIEARRSMFTVDHIAAMKKNNIDPRLVNLYKTVKEFVGIEGPMDDLINKLSVKGDEDVSGKKIKIVALVGVGGLGKTTLAKAVYEKLKLRFECEAFVTVGQNPDMEKVFRDILIGLDKGKYLDLNMKNMDQKLLMDELNGFVKDKRCFIIIDDIWDKKLWELIRCAMQGSHCGTRLVLTTRNIEVATHANIHKIQPLSPENSKKLLYARIGYDEGENLDTMWAEACEKILKKCGGVPLAIITIASLLASRPGEDWSDIYKSIGFGQEENDEVDNTRKILSFSYYDLPSHLKPCLLYLSIFEEDSVIEKNILIWKWVAEGFIIITEEQEAQGVGLFEVGESYFYELINRSMIQPEEVGRDGEVHERYIGSCSIHDMVLDMIRVLSRQEEFATVLEGNNRQGIHAGRIPRRLVLPCDQVHNSGLLHRTAVEKVRTLIAGSSWCHEMLLCPRLPVLRMLDILVVNDDEEEDILRVVCDLGKLLHLRYLSVSLQYDHSVIELPKEVRNLKFLQILHLQADNDKLPEEVGLLTRLVSLRCGIQTRAPAGVIGKLTSLQELCIMCKRPYDAWQFVKELGLLRELRVLSTCIDVTIDGIGRALLESLGNMHNIREVEIHTGGQLLVLLPDTGRTSNVGGISSCYRHLHFMNLENFVFPEVPAWIKSSHAPNLSYLELSVVEVKEQDIQTLARLPELRYLNLGLKGPKFITIRMKIAAKGADGGYFPKLRVLKIHGTGAFIMWGTTAAESHRECSTSSRGASTMTIMPSLESLKFHVHVRLLKHATDQLQFGFDKLLRFDNLGTTSLQKVTAFVNCDGAYPSEVEEAEAALVNAASLHPKHPMLHTDWCHDDDGRVCSPYQEACMKVSRYLGLANKSWKKFSNIGSSWHIQAPHLPDPGASSSKACMKVPIYLGLANKSWKNFSNIGSSRHIQALHLLDPAASSSKVMCLLYTNHGKELLALCSNAVLKLWSLKCCQKNPHGKATTHVPLQLWKPKNGISMKNYTANNGSPEEATACIALSKTGHYLVSATGDRLSLFEKSTFKFNKSTFQIMAGFVVSPPATFVAFHPQDNSIMAIGRDSAIVIYNYRTREVEKVLIGHHNNITGLVFSELMDVLVSSGADAQICVWQMSNWKKKKSRYIIPPSNHSGALVSDTTVQFYYDQEHLLVVQESQLVICDWKMDCLCSWSPRNALPAPISSAVFSSDGLLIYAGFRDGAIGVFEAKSLTLQCKITPSAYIPSSVSCDGGTVYPMVVAADPWKPNQMAVGMSDGAVYVLEPPLDTDV